MLLEMNLGPASGMVNSVCSTYHCIIGSFGAHACMVFTVSLTTYAVILV